MRLLADAETDDLLYGVKQLWCICFKDLETGDRYDFGYKGMFGTRDLSEDLLSFLSNPEIEEIIFHNGIGFDLPALKKLGYLDYTVEDDTLCGNSVIHTDTLILSKLFNPDRANGHSLDAWGERLGYKKYKYSDWSQFTQEMLTYCRRDVDVLEKVYHAVMKESEGWDWTEAIKLEKKVVEIISRQEQHGMLFDVEKAKSHVQWLDTEMARIEDEVEPQLPLRSLPPSQLKSPPKKQFKKDRTPSALAIKYFGEVKKDSKGWYSVEHNVYLPHHEPLITKTPMKLANQADIKAWLMENGWKPTWWNYKKDNKTGKLLRPLEKTTPKLADQQKNLCPNLEKLNGDLVRPIVLWLSYRNRRNVIESKTKDTGWLNKVRSDGRIGTPADTLGTPTARFRHIDVANVPRPSSIFGKEMRELFTTDLSKYYFLGWDASGLEARMEGHYTYKYDGGAYARELTHGDVHSNNAKVFGCDRNTAKSGKYCLSYGGGPPKLADTLGVSKKKGEELHKAFWESNTALCSLRDNLVKYWKTRGKSKFIIGLDGRKVFTRSEHSLINTLFQSAGAIVMKHAMVLMEDWVAEHGYDEAAHGLIRYHK